jgi:hypothetical protein
MRLDMLYKNIYHIYYILPWPCTQRVLVMCPARAPAKSTLAPSYITQFSSLGHDCWCPRCALTCSTRIYIICTTCIKSLIHSLMPSVLVMCPACAPAKYPLAPSYLTQLLSLGHDCWCLRCALTCSTRIYITCTTCIKSLAHSLMPSVLFMCPAWAPGPTKYPLTPSYLTQFLSLGHDCWCPRCALTCSTRTYITCITCIKSLAHSLS